MANNNEQKSKSKLVREKADIEKRMEDLRSQIDAATKARDDKLKRSVAYLVSQLETTAVKYRTVNGFMHARNTIESASFGAPAGDDANQLANELAAVISAMAKELAEKVSETDVEDISEDMLDGYLDEDFISAPVTPVSAAHQLLIADLLRNVGPSIDEIVSFRDSTADELDKVSEELDKLTSELKEIESGLHDGPKLEIVK